MDFEFFEALDSEESAAYFQRFLYAGHASVGELAETCERDGVVADLSTDSIEPVTDWVARIVETVPRQADPQLPEWIRASASYQSNLFDFDEVSKVLILRLAYYIGEAFVRAHPPLAWAVGRNDTAPQGQPAVTGFRHAMEMPVLVVAENLIAGSVSGDHPEGHIATAVAHWVSSVPR